MAKVQAIQEFQRPQTKQDVRAFLRLAGYYLRFIPAPGKVSWTPECEQAFQTLKTRLAT